MSLDASPSLRPAGAEWKAVSAPHDVVCRGEVESPIAADLNADAARLGDQIRGGEAFDDEPWSLVLCKLGNAVELRGVDSTFSRNSEPRTIPRAPCPNTARG
jgi:hypothetical protein